MQKIKTLRGLYALSPIIVLLTIYLVGSIIAGDFYRIPIAVAFMVAAIYAIIITKGDSLNERIDSFSHGAANTRIMYMYGYSCLREHSQRPPRPWEPLTPL